MIASVIPTIGQKGKFTFKEPFTIKGELTLQVTGIRSIFDYIEVGRNLLTDLYLKENLTEENYLEDKYNNVAIITFVDNDRRTYNIPGSYIQKLPTTGTDLATNYKWFQAITSLGILPETYDIGRIEEAIKTAVSQYIGIEPLVLVSVTSTSDDIDVEAADIAEAARVAAVTYKSTLLKDKMDLEAKLASARDQIEELLRVIEDSKLP